MKKVMSLVMVLVCFVAMAGCGEMKESDFEPGKLVKEDFAVIHIETGKKLTLGMTKKEIEKIVGEPTAEYSIGTDYKGELTIRYRGDKVSEIAVFLTKGTPAYKTPRGIAQFSKISDMKEKYGKYVIDSDFDKEGEEDSYYYIMNLKNNEVIKETVNKEYANSVLPIKDIAVLGFNADVDGETIFSFYISDGDANFNRDYLE